MSQFSRRSVKLLTWTLRCRCQLPSGPGPSSPASDRPAGCLY